MKSKVWILVKEKKVNNEINDFYRKIPCIKIKGIKQLEKFEEIYHAKYGFIFYEIDEPDECV